MKEKHKSGIYGSICQCSWFLNNFDEKHKKRCGRNATILTKYGFCEAYLANFVLSYSWVRGMNQSQTIWTCLKHASGHGLHENWTGMEKMGKMESNHQKIGNSIIRKFFIRKRWDVASSRYPWSAKVLFSFTEVVVRWGWIIILLDKSSHTKWELTKVAKDSRE